MRTDVRDQPAPGASPGRAPGVAAPADLVAFASAVGNASAGRLMRSARPLPLPASIAGVPGPVLARNGTAAPPKTPSTAAGNLPANAAEVEQLVKSMLKADALQAELVKLADKAQLPVLPKNMQPSAAVPKVLAAVVEFIKQAVPALVDTALVRDIVAAAKKRWKDIKDSDVVGPVLKVLTPMVKDALTKNKVTFTQVFKLSEKTEGTLYLTVDKIFDGVQKGSIDLQFVTKTWQVKGTATGDGKVTVDLKAVVGDAEFKATYKNGEATANVAYDDKKKGVKGNGSAKVDASGKVEIKADVAKTDPEKEKKVKDALDRIRGNATLGMLMAPKAQQWELAVDANLSYEQFKARARVSASQLGINEAAIQAGFSDKALEVALQAAYANRYGKSLGPLVPGLSGFSLGGMIRTEVTRGVSVYFQGAVSKPGGAPGGPAKPGAAGVTASAEAGIDVKLGTAVSIVAKGKAATAGAGGDDPMATKGGARIDVVIQGTF